MSNTINSLGASRPNLQRSVQPSELEDDGLRPENKRADATKSADAGSAKAQILNAQTARTPGQEGPALVGPPDKIDQLIAREQLDAAGSSQKNQQNLEGLTPAEQQLIYRYFPESPSLELRLYKPDMSTNKVDPGSVGSRVDLRG